ncbi:type I-E CRISPR-associated protein Cas6/Cse3/CasE [Micromonospora sp. NPDC050397]|uniref:type I-E CRISPR-associated protein Cas6/Cse3/CasE n=1 Tax=Micromonospora sp. NPDC050397 TaxID=3364279 RepID=UPI00384A9C41
MYLTRFRINTARRGARKLLTSPQAMHAAVLSGFARPEDHTRDDARTLWRIDHSQDRQVTLYIVSPAQPDLTHLVEQAGWPTTDTWQTRPYTGLLDTLAKGQTWAFRLTANPVRDGRKTTDAPDTQRFGAVTVEYQTQWLTKRAATNGFLIAAQADGHLNLTVHNRQTHNFTRVRGQRPVTLVTATYDGVLQVEDPDPLRRLLRNGIGHARAYGCGLMTLAPAGTGPAR